MSYDSQRFEVVQLGLEYPEPGMRLAEFSDRAEAEAVRDALGHRSLLAGRDLHECRFAARPLVPQGLESPINWTRRLYGNL
jgi:hypothetical protein